MRFACRGLRSNEQGVFMKRILSAAAMIAAGSILFASAALAQSKTAASAMSLTVEAECTVSVDDISFDTIGLMTANDDVQANLSVKCTKGAPYQIGLDKGTTATGTVADRLLANSTSAATAHYQLYQNSGRTTVWGDTQGTNTMDVAASTGAGETIPNYARVPYPQNILAGSYADSVTATIWYGGSILGEE